jgi:hypothetical protein
MQALDLERRAAGSQVVDLCDLCQALWFDPMESPQLSPKATLELSRYPCRATGDAPRIAAIHDSVHGATRRWPRRRTCSTPPGSPTIAACAATAAHSILPVSQGKEFHPADSERRAGAAEVAGQGRPLLELRRRSTSRRPPPANSAAHPSPSSTRKPPAARYRELAAADASNATAPPMDDAARAAAGVMAAAQFQRALAREQALRTDGFAVDLIEVGLAALAAALLRH